MGVLEGIRFGRKPKLSAYQRSEIQDRLAAGESQGALARSYALYATAGTSKQLVSMSGTLVTHPPLPP